MPASDSLQPQSSFLYPSSLLPSSAHACWLFELVNTPVNLPFVDHVVEKVLESCCHALESDALDRDPDLKPAFIDFVIDVVRSCRLSTSTLLVSMVYLDRVKGSLRILSCTSPAHRVFLVSTLLASKYVNDANMTNRDWASCSEFPVKELLLMEREFLAILGYDLRVREDDLEPLYPIFCRLSPLPLPTLRHHAVARRASSHASPLVHTRRRPSAPPLPPTDISHPSPPLYSPVSPMAFEDMWDGPQYGRAGAMAPEPLSPDWPFYQPLLASRPSTGSSCQSDTAVLTPPDFCGFEVDAVDFAYDVRSPDSDESFECGVAFDGIELQSLSDTQFSRTLSPSDLSPSTLFSTSLTHLNGIAERMLCDSTSTVSLAQDDQVARRAQGLRNVTNVFHRNEFVEVDIASGAGTPWKDGQWTWALDAQVVEVKGGKRKDRTRQMGTPPPYRRPTVVQAHY